MQHCFRESEYQVELAYKSWRVMDFWLAHENSWEEELLFEVLDSHFCYEREESNTVTHFTDKKLDYGVKQN